MADIHKPPSEWQFKSTAGYRHILEHVPQQQALDFIACVRDEFPTLWPALLEEVPAIAARNDRYGMPITMSFDEFGVTCSTSNFRYLYHALLVLSDIQRDGRPVVVVELGGGYGGLALYVQALQHHFDDLIQRYIIIDLPEAAALVEAHCRAIELPVAVVNGLDSESIDVTLPQVGPLFFVSCYGFAEFDVATQAWYEDQVIRRCEHGFLAWNYADSWDYRPPNHVYKFADKEIEVEAERPAIAPGCMFVRF